MKHVGYILSCYKDDGVDYSYLYSLPITVSRDQIKSVLNRDYIINGEKLTKDEFNRIAKGFVADVESAWNDGLSFFVEGSNLPKNEDWT